MRDSLDTVFFDAAGTLFRVRETVGTLYWREVAWENGGGEAIGRLDEAFARVLHARQPLLFPDASDEQLPGLERGWWWDVVQATFQQAGLEPVPAVLFERIYQRYATAAAWRLEDGCLEVLQELTRRAFHLGVISNFDSRLPVILEELGIRSFFESVTVSSLVRAAKPDPTIFRLALEATGADKNRAVHIGDTPLDDIEGARAAGIKAILYDPRDQHPEKPARRVRDLREVLDYLL